MYRDMGKKFAGLILILFSGLDAQTALAVSQHHPLLKDNTPLSSYLITLSAGPVWANGGETQTFFFTTGYRKNLYIR